MACVDLHIHTTASDGALTPSEVVAGAKKAGIAAISITDHDTMQGLAEAESAGKKYDVEIVPGVELSTNHKEKEIHILAYYCDPNNPFLKQKLLSFKTNRYDRMESMIKKLNKLGVNIELADVLKVVKGQMLGRPHLALALMEKGYIQEPAEAFEKYIGPSCPAYVKRPKFTPFEAISMIRSAGGIPVLAHPILYNEDSLIPSLVGAGLLGIEVFHPEQGAVSNLRYLKIARKYNLLVTGGSDYHGTENHPVPAIGTVTIKYSYLKKMKEVKKAINKGVLKYFN